MSDPLFPPVDGEQNQGCDRNNVKDPLNQHVSHLFSCQSIGQVIPHYLPARDDGDNDDGEDEEGIESCSQQHRLPQSPHCITFITPTTFITFPHLLLKQRQIFLLEIAQRTQGRIRGRLPQAAQTGVPYHVGQGFQLLQICWGGFLFHELGEQLV